MHFIRPAARSITSISPHCRWVIDRTAKTGPLSVFQALESALTNHYYYTVEFIIITVLLLRQNCATLEFGTVLLWSLVRSGARGVPLGITLNRNMTGNDKRLSVVGRLSLVGIDNNLKWSGCS